MQVCFAGACYTNGQVVNSGQKRPRMMGIMDTSLFPGEFLSLLLITYLGSRLPYEVMSQADLWIAGQGHTPDGPPIL